MIRENVTILGYSISGRSTKILAASLVMLYKVCTVRILLQYYNVSRCKYQTQVMYKSQLQI
jgi:hypothetical protein